MSVSIRVDSSCELLWQSTIDFLRLILFIIILNVFTRNKTSWLEILLALKLYFNYIRILRPCPFLYVGGQFRWTIMTVHDRYFHVRLCFYVVYSVINLNETSLLVTLLALKHYLFYMRIHHLCQFLYVWTVPVQCYDSPPLIFLLLILFLSSLWSN